MLGSLRLVLFLTLAAPVIQAGHLDARHAQHLLQWDQRQSFFETWLTSKQQHPNETFRGLIEGHTDLSSPYPTPKILVPDDLTPARLNYRWLQQGIKAYQQQDWLAAEHALSQLLPPLSTEIVPSAALLKQITFMRLQRPQGLASGLASGHAPELAAELAADRSDPVFGVLLDYAKALAQFNADQPDRALVTLEQLRSTPTQDNSLIQMRLRLLQAYILIQGLRPEQAATLLDDVGSTHPLFALSQQLKAQIQLAEEDAQSAIKLLLEQSQQPSLEQRSLEQPSLEQLPPYKPSPHKQAQPLSAVDIQLLDALQQHQATLQAALLASQWLRPLQRDYIVLLDRIKRINSRAFLNQLGQRQSGDSVTELVALLSDESRLLLTEIERINFLSHQLEGQLHVMPAQLQLFKQGRDHLRTLLHKHRDRIPGSGARLPDTVLRGDRLILELESRLSELVGQPQPWPQRYVLLDGISVWHTGKPFTERWWEPSAKTAPDLGAANQALQRFATEQLSKTSALEALRMERQLLKLPLLAQRAQAMLAQLDNHKDLLLSALAASLRRASAQQVAELEHRLLWLSIQIAPRAPVFDRPEQQRWFNVNVAGAGTPPENTPIPFELALSALEELADNALNPPIQNQALRHLADLRLLLSERFLSGDPIPARPNLNPEGAIGLYLKLLERSDPQISNPQIPDPQIQRAQIFYQLAKAYELNAEPEQSLAALQQLLSSHPEQPLRPEIEFRIAELQFGLRHYALAAQAYQAVLDNDSSAAFRDQARYKRAWSAFKQGQYSAALSDFFILVERHWSPASSTGQALTSQTQTPQTQTRQTVLDDSLRVIALTFAYMDGASSLQQYFGRVGPKPYEAQIYQHLGAYFHYKHRFSDTAETFNALVERFPQSDAAPELQSKVVKAYIDGNFPSKAWPARQDFVERFGIHSPAWKQASAAQRERIRTYLAGYLIELAQRDHALGQQSGQALAPDTDGVEVAPQDDSQGQDADTGRLKRHQHLRNALGWYDQFISALPADPHLPEMLFLKAEALSDIGQPEQAASLYERLAYPKAHPRSMEAGYAALLAYQRLYLNAASKSPEAEKWLLTGIEQSRRFSQVFADSAYTPGVQTKLAEDLWIHNDYAQAISAADRLLLSDPGLDPGLGVGLDTELRQRLWRVKAHAHFDTRRYPEAEQAYQQLLRLSPPAAERETLLRRLAESVYQQGAQAQREAQMTIALGHYQRLGRVVPDAHIVPQADFDAATLLLQLKRWPEAVAALERFSQEHPGNPLQTTIDARKAIAYEQTQNWPQAALALRRIFEREQGAPLGREALWRSAELQEKAGQPKQAILAYQRFVEFFPSPHEPAMEARWKLAQLNQQLGRGPRQRGLQALIAAEIQARMAQGDAASTDRSLFIASGAALTLAKQALSEFQNQALTLPLEKSLPLKRHAMETSIRYLAQTRDFGLAPQSTEATALTGQLYQQFAQALLVSQRPKGLEGLALEQYSILLEEQALPFEDQAISLHELNVSRIVQDIYTPGIASSLDALRQLMPARYARDEQVPEYSDAL
ncbi:MAG: tetratricopeptide (TPR) repeat protein [Motiliproteus sp.]|jgi:tetratricopeptide (TPR) repeat protein